MNPVLQHGAEVRLLCAAARAHAGLGPAIGPQSLQNVDWARFERLLAHHRFFAQGYGALRSVQNLLPAPLAEALTRHFMQTAARQEAQRRELLDVLSACGRKGIRAVPIKGAALDLMAAPEAPSVRRAGDIDLLIRKSDLPVMHEILSARGYREELFGNTPGYWTQKHFELAFVHPGKTFCPMIDVHWNYDFVRRAPDLDPVWERLCEIRVEGQAVSLLSAEDMFVGAAFNVRHFGAPLELKKLCDFVRLSRRAGEKGIDAAYLGRQLRQCRVRRAFGILAQACAEVFPTEGWRPPLQEEIPLTPGTRGVIRRMLFDPEGNAKALYLALLLRAFDRLYEAPGYLLDVPLEAFCKYFGLDPLRAGARLRYVLRPVYAPGAVLAGAIRRSFARPEAEKQD